jgi:hypothetical protein
MKKKEKGKTKEEREAVFQLHYQVLSLFSVASG